MQHSFLFIAAPLVYPGRHRLSPEYYASTFLVSPLAVQHNSYYMRRNSFEGEIRLTISQRNDLAVSAQRGIRFRAFVELFKAANVLNLIAGHLFVDWARLAVGLLSRIRFPWDCC